MRLSAAALLATVTLARTLGATALDDLLRASCTHEPALTTAARAALEAAPAETLRDLAVASGLAAPVVHLGVFPWTSPGASVEPVRQWLGPRAQGARCAIARRDQRLAVVLVPPLARISPLPTRASPGATLDLAVTLPTNTAAPWVYILDPSGGVVSWALPEDQRVRWTVPGEGSYTIEITGNSGNGPRALARWRLVAGAPSPEAPSATVATLDALVGAVNDLRRQSGLAPLRRDPLLGEVAARRARELAAALVLAHGAEGDGPVERLAESAVSARRVAENLARAPSLTDAHARLCASPSHRVVLLDPALDAVGVGVALTPTGVYLVELFAQAPALRTGP